MVVDRTLMAVWIVLVAAGLVSSGPCGLALLAAQPELAPGGAALQDSAAVRDEAEDAQADFEQARVGLLPWTRSAPPQPCDEIVGRFCFWHGHGEDAWTPSPEHPDVEQARERLLGQLAKAARTVPGDGWIAGQRVRYLVEAGRLREALAVARACRAEPWWCRALEGYATHVSGDHAGAEAAFDAALAAMPPAERERWTDLELILDRDLARTWKALGAGARAAFARRLWWLADPLWSVPGNERRTEHFARHALDRLLESARNPYRIGWGSDLRELTIRYGWSVGWERVRPDLGSLGSGSRPSVVGHDPPGGRRFVPPIEVFVAPFEARPEDWPLAPSRPRSTYAPAYADSVLELAHQLAVFRRGDSAVVAASYELEDDGTSQVERAALVVASGPDAAPARVDTNSPHRGLSVGAPWAPLVASLEVRAGGRAARARYGLGLPSAPFALSDVLLLTWRGSLPATLPEALSMARGSTRVSTRERVAIYFEVYPPEGSSGAARIELSLRDERGGFWRGLGAMLGLGAAPTGEVALAWSEAVAPGTSVHPRALLVELPAVPAGEYALVLEVTLPDASTARTERRISLR
jgi:hypothetical protein